MVERESEHEGSYWGCMGYPRCRQVLPMAQTG
jgi:ssDNA-binding Zn-finger/Zn-ribbon topoisomerase 1